MAEKTFKLTIKVDLRCCCCYKKIQKILCKIQERYQSIKTITYDVKNNTVTLSGPFDAEMLERKLRCMACRVIIDIKSEEVKPPKPKTTEITEEILVCEPCKKPKCTVIKKRITEKTKDTPSKKDDEKKTKDVHVVVCGHPQCSDPCPPPCESPCQPKCEPPCPPSCEPPCPPPCPPPCQPPICQVCCRMPSSGGNQGGSCCYSCGRIYGCAPDCPPMPYGGTSYGGYQFILKEDPSTSCTIM
ncbi:protein PYRICULARIA ORYZAE RESISTANCE 21-like [Phoenix dactylifera]|uniref:Protein PYRICULARIA ORYZAE RESISTANCE 21-like n=1 Tax=Phoenix dactylifera TaxID=42345 RepID=A0A8B9AI28_PHODC|nr:protein PYRICULARIA ORYZAE RESISTANCE 21-like [Phoenix dactylifera]